MCTRTRAQRQNADAVGEVRVSQEGTSGAQLLGTVDETALKHDSASDLKLLNRGRDQ